MVLSPSYCVALVAQDVSCSRFRMMCCIRLTIAASPLVFMLFRHVPCLPFMCDLVVVIDDCQRPLFDERLQNYSLIISVLQCLLDIVLLFLFKFVHRDSFRVLGGVVSLVVDLWLSSPA